MKKICFFLCSLTFLHSSCGSKRYAITATGEDLTSLTKVTDNDEPCISPFGGDNGKDLFFAACENKDYYNSYKKDNPFSSAMTQKTSGKNYNISPTYCVANDKIAFQCKLEGASSSDIYMMNNNQGKPLSQITETNDAYELGPCFSTDGKFLVYAKVLKSNYDLYDRFGEVWMKNLETGENILLGNGSQPSSSPDGNTIAFVKYSADSKSVA